jgi:nucleotide-binding universal stress UspA family protein
VTAAVNAPLEVETILVPYDGSELSARAIPVGVRLADRFDASLVIFSSVPSEDERRPRLVDIRLVAPRDHEYRPWVVVSKDPAGAIHEAIRQVHAALACMATHGRGRSAAVLGSVATEVLARGHDALVLVGPMVDLEIEGKGVVACIDESVSQDLLHTAARVAQLLGEPLTVITVAEPVPPPLTAGPPRRRFGPDEDVEMFLRAAVAPLRAAGYTVETRAVYDPVSPAAGVRDYVWQHPCSLLAVASRARTGVQRFLFGSVAAQIVRSVTAPVLAVPRHDTR